MSWMTDGTDWKNVIVQEACRWFASKRPQGCWADQHYRNPSMNCKTEQEAELANAVAQYLKNDLEKRRDHDL